MKIAVIGNGIVGATFVNERINRFPKDQIVQFNGIDGTATTASAGIIAPWLSKRRNQKWYQLACQGAEYMHQLSVKYAMSTDVYCQSGVIYTRDSPDKIDELYELAEQRIEKAPQMKSFRRLSSAEINQQLSFADTNDTGLLVEGGARIDGQKFVALMNRLNAVEIRSEKAQLNRIGDQLTVNDEPFDLVVLACGAWLKETLQNLGYYTKIRPQKGQLIEVELPKELNPNENEPVLMPEGERDFIPTSQHTLLIGATHENDEGFDLTVSNQIIDDLLASGQRVIPSLTKEMVSDVRVGTRAYTEDFAPFFGYLPDDEHLLVASGLGSSGLTTGPIIAKLLADLIEDPKLDVSSYTKPVDFYIKKGE